MEIIICIVLAVAGVGAAIYFYVQAASLRQRLSERTQSLEEAQAQLENLRQNLAERDREIAVFHEKQHSHEQRLEDLRKQHEQAQQQASATFKSLANEAMKQARDEFLKLANESFASKQQNATAQLEQRKQAIEAMLKPIRESLDKHATAVQTIEKTREGAYHGLKQQLTTMVEDQRRLQSETANLVKALRRPEARGRWGETQLRRVVELAGMIDHCDFTEQTSSTDRDGRMLRPDMVVHLPAGREVVVDSKTPINAYLEALEAETDEGREQCLDRFVRHVQDQVASLSSKQYQNQFQRSPDFVVMFIPGEAFLQVALQRKPEIMEDAFNRNVVIATPSTLIALLKAVAIGWREEKLAENASHIRDLGVELHNRLATMTQHLTNVGKAVDKTVEHFNKLVGSYESQVMVQARRFKDLNAGSPKALPAEGGLPSVDQHTRQLRDVDSSEDSVTEKE